MRLNKYIEWDLENNPELFKKISGEGFVDKAVLRHVVANVNCPDGVPNDLFHTVLNAVIEETELIPAADAEPVKRKN